MIQSWKPFGGRGSGEIRVSDSGDLARPERWKSQALGALPEDVVWSVYTDWLYGVAERPVLDGVLTLVDGQYTSDGQSRRVPSLADPFTMAFARLWTTGQHYAALMLITGLWLRVRARQEELGRIPWPVDDLLDGLRFYTRGRQWTDEDHREFSAIFWKHIAEPTIEEYCKHIGEDQ